MSEKITIYIPAYNAEKTIEQSIISIKNQTYEVDEIIIIDDNSSDKTHEIINQYKDIILIKNQKNMGLSFSRNLAIKKSSNEIVGAIDSDVVLDKYWLEILLNNINQSQIVMCCGNMTEKFITNKFNAWRAKYYSQNWGNKDIINPAFLYGCNTLLLKSAWRNVDGYNNEFRTNGEDVNFSKVLKSKDCNLYYEPKALCYHYQFDDALSLSKRYWRYTYYGAGLKKLTFIRLIKLILRQIKTFFFWMSRDILKNNYHFFKINLILTYYFSIFCINKYLFNDKK